MGDFRSRQLGAIVASILVFVIALLFSRWINAETAVRLLGVGALWIVLTLSFEVGVGVYLLGSDQRRLLEDYNIAHGGLMPFALLFVLFTPMMAYAIRNRWPGRSEI